MAFPHFGKSPDGPGGAIRAIVSPAKKMVVDDAFEVRDLPVFIREAGMLVERLQALPYDDLRSLWGCSDALARTASDDLRALDPGRLAQPGALPSPAAMSYVGIQYQSMAPQVMSADAIAWLAGHLRIASGLFGILRPFDGVAPYRLEMQARLAMPCRVDAPGALRAGAARNLYEFWGSSLARALEDEARTGPDRGATNGRRPSGIHVVNLASVEYANAVVPHLAPETPITTCIFLEPRADGELVQRATASKIARGTMVRWMAENGIEDPCDLRSFDLGGYRLDPARSHADGRATLLAFSRSAPAPTDPRADQPTQAAPVPKTGGRRM